MKGVVVVFLVSVLCFLSLGCGKSGNSTGNVNLIDGAMPVVADNPQVKKLNSQLGHITDQSSAEKAVNTFVDYVDSRLVKGVHAQSLRSLISKDTVAEIARQEVLTRQGEVVRVLASSEESLEIVKAPIDIGLVADQVNDLGQEEGFRINDKMVSQAKTVTEASIPNLNPQSKGSFSPMSAMVVGYSLVSGDDGTAKENSVKVSTDKISQFVTNVVE